ncbi:MAG: glycosyltransferase family 39 protein [Burkholderiales bacterium]|nr:glycosyltransferase family 39 protein [Burkholderiales bacterium]
MSRRTWLVTLLCAAWLLPGLVGHDPWKPDEAHTFGVVYELLRGGSWVVPALAGEPFLDKPPLLHLTAAAFARVLSPALPLHDAARLAAGAWMALVFAFTAAASRELHGTDHGALAVLLLLGCFGLVVRSHQLITDVAMLAGFAMAYYGFALAPRRALPGGYWFGTGAGVGFLANGPVAPLAIAALAALLPLLGRSWRSANYARAAALAAAAAAPWLLVWPLMLRSHSPELFGQWLWEANFKDYLAATAGFGESAFYYLKLLPWYGFPAWLLALWALWRTPRRDGWSEPRVALPLAGFLVTFAALGASADARELYALPLLLPLALLAVPAPATLRRGASNAWYWFSVMTWTFFIIVFWVYWSGLELGVPERLHRHLHAIRPGYEYGFRWLPFTVGVLYTATWCAVLVLLRKSVERPVIAWAAGITVMWGLLAVLFVGWADNVKSYRAVFVEMKRALPKKFQCIASRELGDPQRASLRYFADIITYREEIPARRRDCDLLLVQGGPRDDAHPGRQWKRIWEGRRPGDKDERYRLYQRVKK